MKKQTLIIVVFIFLLSTFSSCALVEGIFKAGMGVGIFMVLLVVALIIFFVIRMSKKK